MIAEAAYQGIALLFLGHVGLLAPDEAVPESIVSGTRGGHHFPALAAQGVCFVFVLDAPRLDLRRLGVHAIDQARSHQRTK
jgi:hypothetical protein